MSRNGAQRSVDDSLLATVAWMYHVEGRTQAEVASCFGVSRPTIISYLQRARATGILQVKIDRAVLSQHEVVRLLKKRFNLDEVYVLSSQQEMDAAEPDAHVRRTQTVASFAASLLPDLLSSGDRLGVSWGETIFYLSEAMTHRSIDNLTVIQLLGAMHSSPVTTSTADVAGAAETIARKLDARCANLHVPAIVSSRELASALREEPIIKSQFECMNACNKLVFSIGGCSESTHIVQSGIADLAVLRDYAERGAVGVMHCRFIDRDGKTIRGQFDDRLLAVDLDRLHNPEVGLLVVAGAAKADAALAAIRGRFVTHLVADETLADAMLENLRLETPRGKKAK